MNTYPATTIKQISPGWPDEVKEYQAQNDHNHLLSIATPLITLMTCIRHTIDQKNVAKFREQMIEEINYFEDRLRRIRYTNRTILAARYCLCTAIDEAVLSRPWGTASPWVQGSLLAHFHKETWGGERFYSITQEMAKDPRTNIDFLEFAYCLLSLGFEGKFYGEQLVYREDIRNRIFHRIRFSKHKPDKLLSPHWKDEQLHNPKVHKKAHLKRTMLITIFIIAFIVVVFNVKATHASKTLLNNISNIATVSPITSFSEVIQRPIIERID